MIRPTAALLIAAWLWSVAAPAPGRDVPAPEIDPAHQRRDTLTAALEIDPDGRATRLALARTLGSLGDWKAGLDVLAPLLAAVPDDPEIQQVRNALFETRMETASMFGMLGAARKYRKNCEADLERDPENPVALLCLGRYLYQAPGIAGGSDQRARRVLARLRSLDPYRYWMLKAEIAAEEAETREEVDRVEADFERAIAAGLRSDAVPVIVDWAVRNDRFALGFAAIDAYRACNAPDPIADYELGKLAAFSGRGKERGIEALRRFLEGPTWRRGSDYRASAHVWLGVIHERLGDREFARTQYHLALALDEDHDNAQNGLARLDGNRNPLDGIHPDAGGEMHKVPPQCSRRLQPAGDGNPSS